MSETGEEPQRAPGSLEVVRRFVNTLDVESGTDELSDPEALKAWCGAHGLGAEGPFREEDLDWARSARTALREILMAHAGEGDSLEGAQRLDRLAAQVPMGLRFSDGTAQFVPLEGGPRAAFGELLGIIATSMAEGTWTRLKACLRDDCRWAFYDSARNRSGKWCSMAVCGNRTKAEKFRSRHGAGRE